MDRDKLVQEIERLQDWLASHSETDPDYDDVMGKFIKLAELLMKFDDSCDKQNERQFKQGIERDRMEKEFDLREKELERRHEIDMLKVQNETEEIYLKHEVDEKKLSNDAVNIAENRRNQKRQARWELIKIGFSTIGSVVLIVVTGKIEQTAILGQHQWSLIPKGPKF